MTRAAEDAAPDPEVVDVQIIVYSGSLAGGDAAPDLDSTGDASISPQYSIRNSARSSGSDVRRTS
eukprot:1439493-Heterocapsa_arctica.AAC.1